MCRQSIVILHRSMLSIDEGSGITSSERGVNTAIQLLTLECCCLHCTILYRLKVINYLYEIPSYRQRGLLNETTFFGGEFDRQLGCGFDPNILSVSGVTIKYPPHLIACNNSSMPEATTIRRIFEQFSAGVHTLLFLLLMLLLL